MHTKVPLKTHSMKYVLTLQIFFDPVEYATNGMGRFLGVEKFLLPQSQ